MPNVRDRTPLLEQPRVLDADPVTSLQGWTSIGGGDGLEAARKLGAAGTIAEIEASGLRGRGGGGFPTGTKWRTVAGYRTDATPPTVVVNGAEGEPGSFKDRAILRANPYRVLEGAIIAAEAIGADRIVVALKASFDQERAVVRRAADELTGAGLSHGMTIEILDGPTEYLFGEETALLEVLDGRPPFPRIAPPYRHGADEVGDGAASPADVTMASSVDDASPAAPTLVNNVETMANVPGILAKGATWFREVGTDESPGTIVCTVTGDTHRHAVGEVPMGTPLRAVIDEIGGGPLGDDIQAVMSGVANALLAPTQLDTPVSHEAMAAISSGIGATGFIVFDDHTDLVAVAHGVSRFLAVESCGQCTPCKQDGLAIAGLLDGVRRSTADEHDLEQITDLLGTVADGTRCYLATQHQLVVQSILDGFPNAWTRHLSGALQEADSYLIAPIVDIVDGKVILDDEQATKQPDWTHDAEPSGQSPADRIDESAAG